MICFRDNKGEKHRTAKFSDATCDGIRKAWDNGEDQKEIAARFGCNVQYVREVGNRRKRQKFDDNVEWIGLREKNLNKKRNRTAKTCG